MAVEHSEYKKYKIMVRGDGTWETQDGETSISASSLVALKKKIDDRIKATVQARKLALKVISEDGVCHKITGINTHEWGPTGLPREAKSQPIYVHTQGVVAKLEELAYLQRQERELRAQLDQCRLFISRHSYTNQPGIFSYNDRLDTPAQYEAALQKVEAAYDRAKAKAIAMYGAVRA